MTVTRMLEALNWLGLGKTSARHASGWQIYSTAIKGRRCNDSL